MELFTTSEEPDATVDVFGVAPLEQATSVA